MSCSVRSTAGHGGEDAGFAGCCGLLLIAAERRRPVRRPCEVCPMFEQEADEALVAATFAAAGLPLSRYVGSLSGARVMPLHVRGRRKYVEHTCAPERRSRAKAGFCRLIGPARAQDQAPGGTVEDFRRGGVGMGPPRKSTRPQLRSTSVASPIFTYSGGVAWLRHAQQWLPGAGLALLFLLVVRGQFASLPLSPAQVQLLGGEAMPQLAFLAIAIRSTPLPAARRSACSWRCCSSMLAPACCARSSSARCRQAPRARWRRPASLACVERVGREPYAKGEFWPFGRSIRPHFWPPQAVIAARDRLSA